MGRRCDILLKAKGSEFVDNLTVNPHKMMEVPLTRSFLLVADIKKLWRANTARRIFCSMAMLGMFVPTESRTVSRKIYVVIKKCGT